MAQQTEFDRSLVQGLQRLNEAVKPLHAALVEAYIAAHYRLAAEVARMLRSSGRER